LGDTIRVSLTEDSPREIAVCNDLLEELPSLVAAEPMAGWVPDAPLSWDPFSFQRRTSVQVPLGGTSGGADQTVRVVVPRSVYDTVAPRIAAKADVRPEAILEDLSLVPVPFLDRRVLDGLQADDVWVTIADAPGIPPITAFRWLTVELARRGRRNPILLKDTMDVPHPPLPPQKALLRSAVVLGSLLADGIGDAILVRNESGPGQSLRLAFNLLQAAGCRSFKTDYVACPSCGRTLFNLQEVTARIKARTDHLKGVKIAIMGCIVNGPGEMADADFGYVGGAPGKINLYIGKNAVKFNIPEAEAVDRLVDLIRDNGKWVDPDPSTPETA
jgi:(E)-4-hydroxy-3-methylbut-2-enyl-diphosphate synthase